MKTGGFFFAFIFSFFQIVFFRVYIPLNLRLLLKGVDIYRKVFWFEIDFVPLHHITLTMSMPNRCLYIATFKEFLEQERLAVLGALHSNYHGEALTTTDEAWMGEIDIMQQVLYPWKDENAHIIFEYEIPRMGKRIDVVLLLRGIIQSRTKGRSTS